MLAAGAGEFVGVQRLAQIVGSRPEQSGIYIDDEARQRSGEAIQKFDGGGVDEGQVSDEQRRCLPNADDMDMGYGKRPAGRVDQTTIGSLGLEVGRSFGYWFDFGDDWWHQIDETAIEEKAPTGKYPKVTKMVGKSPPQYPDE